MLQSVEQFLRKRNPDFSFSKNGINNFLKCLYENFAPSQIRLQEIKHSRKDWISLDIKLILDLQGNPLSRERQGKIQIIRDSKFATLNSFSDEIKNKIKEIFLSCLEKREPKYRIRQELFDNFASLNWDCYDFVDYELNLASSLAYIKDEVYNSKPGEKVYFKRFEQEDCCYKCKKLKNKIALWSDIPLDCNETDDKFANFVIWDDRFTDKKSKIPLTCERGICDASWIRYYPEFDLSNT